MFVAMEFSVVVVRLRHVDALKASWRRGARAIDICDEQG